MRTKVYISSKVEDYKVKIEMAMQEQEGPSYKVQKVES